MASSWNHVAPLAFALVLLAFPASAETWFDDPASDHQVVASGQAASAGDQLREIDLVEVTLSEAPDGFEVGFRSSATDPDDLVGGQCMLYFGLRGLSYQVHVPTWSSGQAHLRRLDEASGAYVEVANLGLAVQDGDLHKVLVPRAKVTDADGVQASRGTSFESPWSHCFALRSWSSTPAGPVYLMEVSDRAPDQGTGPAWEVKSGQPPVGSARLAAPRPMRASNGEASTFVFPLQAKNAGDREETYTLRASSVPADWLVRIPRAEVTLAPGAVAEVNVVVRSTFTHEHGTRATFAVEMTGRSQPTSRASVELGLD